MTTRTVTEQLPQVFPQFPIQGQGVELVRVQQQGLRAQGQNLFGRVENQAEARERAVNNAMQLQIYERILVFGKLIQSAQDTHVILLTENQALKGQIVERIESLEKEWFGVAEQLCVKVDTFYRSAKGFFQQFGPEKHVATQIRNRLMEISTCKSFVPNKMWLMFQGYYFCGRHEEDGSLRYQYSVEVDNILPAIKQLHLTGRGTLKERVKAEIQKIQKEMLIEEPKEQAPLLNPHDAVVIDGGDVLQAFLQGRQQEITFLEELNLPLSKANACLRERKVELMNMEKRFFAVFDRPLEPCFEWGKWSKLMVKYLNTRWEEFPKKCDGIAQHCNVPIREAKVYTNAYELNRKFEQHLKEIEPLLEALQKKTIA